VIINLVPENSTRSGAELKGWIESDVLIPEVETSTTKILEKTSIDMAG